LTVVATGRGAEVVRDLGTGPTVVLVHGVGVGPASFDGVVDALVGTHRVVVLRRPALVPGTAPVPRAAGVLRAAVHRLAAGPVTLVGVSGGATLSLAAAMAEPGLFHAVVAHEPLVGSHAPGLHRRVGTGAARLTAGSIEPDEWLRALVGEASWLASRSNGGPAEIVAEEVAAFAAWSPTIDELAVLRGETLVTTIGSASGRDRHEAAAALARLGGARVVVLGGAGHLPQLEAPEAFAAVVSDTTRDRSTP